MGVDLKESAEYAIRRSGHKQRRERLGKSDPKQHGCAAEKCYYLKSKTEARHSGHKTIRHDPSEKDCTKREKMMPQHDPFPGLANINGELLGGKLRRPEKICVVHKYYRNKARRCTQRGRIAEISPEGLTQTKPSSLFTLYSFPFTTHPILQRPDENDAKQTSGHAKCHEHATP